MTEITTTWIPYNTRQLGEAAATQSDFDSKSAFGVGSALDLGASENGEIVRYLAGTIRGPMGPGAGIAPAGVGRAKLTLGA